MKGKFPQITWLGLFFLAGIVQALAMDVSPYKAGQVLTAEQAEELKQRYADRSIQEWKPAPDKATINSQTDADLILYGIQVLDKTAESIGPKAADAAKRYSGNNLNCSSCHQKGTDGLPGTKYYSMPFNNVVNDYPNFRSRSMAIGSAADRVNGCMTRSMGDGRALPEDSREMQGILAYFEWLATGSKKNMAMKGTGLPKTDIPPRTADVSRGKLVYEKNCQSCHGITGLGTKGPDFETSGNYIFPPLAGSDSFNDGAGMSRILKSTRFIHANMPLGTQSDKPALSADDAFDVAGYVESLKRPHKEGRDKDFPNEKFRPVDYPVPEYFNGDKKKLERAKYGPFTNDLR